MTIDPQVLDQLIEIAAILSKELGVKYEVRAVVRGLLAIAIARIFVDIYVEKPLAPWFVGARAKRGRRKMGPQPEPEGRILPW